MNRRNFFGVIAAYLWAPRVKAIVKPTGFTGFRLFTGTNPERMYELDPIKYIGTMSVKAGDKWKEVARINSATLTFTPGRMEFIQPGLPFKPHTITATFKMLDGSLLTEQFQ